MALTYTLPGITVSTLGATTPLVAGPSRTTILALATFPKGPDYPVLVKPEDAAATFGDPTQSSSVGYTGPWGLQMVANQQQGRIATPIQFLVCRVGVTRGLLALAGATGTVATVYGIGRYAGSASANLKVQVAGTTVSTLVITLTDGPTGRVLQTFSANQYDLSSNQAIANAINGANSLTNAASVAYATAGAGTGLPVVISATSLSAGTDGKGAVYSDATVAALLTNSFWAHVDYIWAAYDAALISTALLTHLSAGVAQAELRRAILGPAAGTTYSSLSGAYNTMLSSRIRTMAHDAIRARNPATGILGQVDGWMLAAAYAGMKANAGVAETCAGFFPVGITDIAVPSDLTSFPTPAQLQTLGGAGLLYFKQPPGQLLPSVGDDITTAPYAVNNAVNPFYHGNVQDIDDTVLATGVAASAQYNGRGMPSFATLQDAIQSATKTAVQALTGRVINGVNAVQTTLDPSTNSPTTSINYQTKWPISQMNVQTGFTFS